MMMMKKKMNRIFFREKKMFFIFSFIFILPLYYVVFKRNNYRLKVINNYNSIKTSLDVVTKEYFIYQKLKYCVNSTTNPGFVVCTHNPSVDVFISASILENGIWEPEISKILKIILIEYPTAWFLDLGANIGFHSLFAAKLGHQVLAVEPQTKNMIRVI